MMRASGSSVIPPSSDYGASTSSEVGGSVFVPPKARIPSDIPPADADAHGTRPATYGQPYGQTHIQSQYTPTLPPVTAPLRPRTGSTMALTQPPQPPVEEEEDEAVCPRLSAFAAYVTQGDFLLNLRMAVKALMTFACFVMWGATEQKATCRADLADWLLINALVSVVLLIVFLLTCHSLHRMLSRYFGAGAEMSDAQFAMLRKGNWAVSAVFALWTAAWVIVSLAKLKRATKQTCGSAFQGVLGMVSMGFVVLLLTFLCFISFVTVNKDDDGADRPGMIWGQPHDPPRGAPIASSRPLPPAPMPRSGSALQPPPPQQMRPVHALPHPSPPVHRGEAEFQNPVMP